MQQRPMKITRIERKCDICGKTILKGQKYGKTRKMGVIYCERCE